MDLAAYSPSCALVPGRLPTGPGWYLISLENARVEAGPFASEASALEAGLWMDDQAWGVNPQPYQPTYSPRGLLIGVRFRFDRAPALTAVA